MDVQKQFVTTHNKPWHSVILEILIEAERVEHTHVLILLLMFSENKAKSDDAESEILIHFFKLNLKTLWVSHRFFCYCRRDNGLSVLKWRPESIHISNWISPPACLRQSYVTLWGVGLAPDFV